MIASHRFNSQCCHFFPPSFLFNPLFFPPQPCSGSYIISGFVDQWAETVAASHIYSCNSCFRVGQVEGEVGALSERVTELLAEKEKALADLKTIRKTNKIM